MKVLHVISHGYLAGGAEKSVVMISEELRRRGHAVKILAADTPGKTSFSNYQFATINPASPLKWLSHIFYPASYRAVRAAVKEFRPNIIHFHTLTSCTPSVLFGTRGVPAVLTIHGPEEFTARLIRWFLSPTDYRTRPFDLSDLTTIGRFRYGYYRWVQRPVYQLGFKRLARIIAPSKYILESTRADFAGRPMIHIPNGISANHAHEPSVKPQLLFVGRLEKVKGVDVLIRALAVARPNVPGVSLRIVGDGPGRTEFERLATKLNLTEQVTFVGWLGADAIAGEYARAAALVVPSVWPENLPTVCTEAMSTGLPVIGSNTGGIPELIDHGVTGLIVPVGDSAALGAAITTLLTDPAAIRRYSAASIKKAQDFSLDTFVTRLETLYSHPKP